MKFFAFVPFKSRSVRFPDKNFSRFGGSDLLNHLVGKLHSNPKIERIFISTDVPDRVVLSCLSDNVHVVKRPLSLTYDDTSTDDVVKQFIDFNREDGCDAVVVSQVTSPVWRPVSLSRALYVFESNNYDSVVSVSPSFEPNGCFYIVKTKDFKSIYNDNMFLVVLGWDECVDIDYEYQLKIAGAVYKKRFLE